MRPSINRRKFLKTSVALAVVPGSKSISAIVGDSSLKQQEYYELRVYRTNSALKKASLENYLEKALLPALNRMAIDRVAVLSNMDDAEDFSLYVLIPYKTIAIFTALNPELLQDKEYLSAAREHFASLKEDPLFTRIQNRFCKAFSGMPVMEIPGPILDSKPDIFELRIYESHTEEKAALKIDMFNSGEIQVMREVGLAPVFFGETLIGDDLPNLTYMLSAPDLETHQAHWSKFSEHPEWIHMKEMAKYKDTVSKITKIFLKPTAYSQIM